MNYFRIFILILCLLRIVIAQNPNEWPIVHNLGHTGFSPTTQLRPPLQVKWTAKLQGNFKNGPVVAEGKLVVKSNRGYVFCLDAETGELVWRHFVPFVPGIRISEGAGNINVRGPSAPGIFNGRVYVNFHTAGYPEISGLRCFDLETGEEKWRVKAGFVPNWLRYSPQVSKGKLFFISHLPIKPSPDNRRDTCFRPFVQVWDAETGDSLWTYAMWDTACPTISLLAAGDTVFASASDAGGQGKTVALDLDGNVLWTNPDYSCTGTATIQYLDDKIVLNDTYLKASDGSLIRTGMYSQGGKIATHLNGYFWTSGYADLPHKTDTANGNYIMAATSQASLVTSCSSILATSGIIYESFGGGTEAASGHLLIAFDESTGQEVWKYQTGSNNCAPMAIAYDKLYALSTSEGMLYCFENGE